MLEINLQKMRHKLRIMRNKSKNRLTWRKVIFEATGRLEESSREHARLKRDLRKGNITEHVTELTCGHCGKTCLSRADFWSHLKSHRHRAFLAKHEKVISVHTTRQNFIFPMPCSSICNICGKVCKSVGCMKRHEKVHISNTLTHPSIPNLVLLVYVSRRGKLQN